MKIVLRFSLFALLCAAMAGCRSDPSVSLLEAEMRWLEDQYYVLEEQYHQKCNELESCRYANQAQTPTNADASADASQGERPPSSRRTQDGDTPPVEPPRIEGIPGVGMGADGAFENLPDLQPPDSGPGVRPSSYHVPADARVTNIALNRQLTGGYDRDGLPGDDGVMVVIEPRNSSGQFVPQAGAVYVKLTDPQAPATDRPLAQWQLTAEQAARKIRRSLLGRGVHLELAWPARPPRRKELELSVIYATADGRKLTAQRKVRIDPPRDPSRCWTPVSDAAAPEAPSTDSTGPLNRNSVPRPRWSPDR